MRLLRTCCCAVSPACATLGAALSCMTTSFLRSVTLSSSSVSSRRRAIRLRCFVEATAAQDDSFGAEPIVDHLPGDFPWRDDARLRSPTLFLAAGFGARHHSAGAMHCRPERRLRFFRHARSALEDHRVITHGSADEAALGGKGGSGALANHYQFF